MKKEIRKKRSEFSDKENIIFYTDEFGIKNTFRNIYACSKRGKLVNDERKCLSTENLNIVA